MTRYEVVFSARALVSLREVTRYIAEESGTARAADWLARVMDSHPLASAALALATPSRRHWTILSHLSAEPSLALRELADRTGITPDGIKYRQRVPP